MIATAGQKRERKRVPVTRDLLGQLLKRHSDLYKRWLKSAESASFNNGRPTELRRRMLDEMRQINQWIESGQIPTDALDQESDAQRRLDRC